MSLLQQGPCVLQTALLLLEQAPGEVREAGAGVGFQPSSVQVAHHCHVALAGFHARPGVPDSMALRTLPPQTHSGHACIVQCAWFCQKPSATVTDLTTAMDLLVAVEADTSEPNLSCPQEVNACSCVVSSLATLLHEADTCTQTNMHNNSASPQLCLRSICLEKATALTMTVLVPSKNHWRASSV